MTRFHALLKPHDCELNLFWVWVGEGGISEFLIQGGTWSCDPCSIPVMSHSAFTSITRGNLIMNYMHYSYFSTFCSSVVRALVCQPSGQGSILSMSLTKSAVIKTQTQLYVGSTGGLLSPTKTKSVPLNAQTAAPVEVPLVLSNKILGKNNIVTFGQTTNIFARIRISTLQGLCQDAERLHCSQVFIWSWPT